MDELNMLVRVFERSQDAVEITDGHGVYVYVNHAFEVATGYTAAEAVGQRPATILRSGLHPEAFYDVMWTELMAGRSVARTVASRRKDGAVVMHEITVTPVLNAEGAIEWVVGIRRDQTERVAREELLRATASFYQEVFERNPAIKLLIDPESGCIIDANEAAVAFYGWSRATLLGMNVNQINTLTAEETREEMELALSQKRTHFRFVHRIASGATRSVEVFTGPAVVDGRTRLLSIIQDVTEREHLEEQLRRSQRLEAVGRLAGGIAHDFNNLLQVIVSSTSFLRRKIDDSNPLRIHVDRIDDAAERGADFTRQLLLFSRGDTSRVELVDINAVVADLARLFGATLGAHVRLEVERECGPAPLSVRIARSSVEQVLLNLVVNARDAMESSGTVRIRTARVAADACSQMRTPDVTHVLIEVSDDGQGMSAEVLEHAFEPFFSTKGEGRGTGLGLAILYGVVQRAGGTVAAKSEVGVGTVFSVWLPRVEEIPSAAIPIPPTELRAFDGAQTTVLLAEDEADVRAVIASMLVEHGCRVHVANDADHALELARTFGDTIDLLLTDVVMPGLTGPELAQQVRVACPGIDVVFMSGYPGDAWERHGPLDATLLSKPFGSGELAAALRAVRDTSHGG